jgi:hypothetical protein
MEYSVTEIGRAVRRRLERVVRNSRDKDFARRAWAVLHLWETGGNVEFERLVPRYIDGDHCLRLTQSKDCVRSLGAAVIGRPVMRCSRHSRR